MIAIIGGEFRRFRVLVDLYCEASVKAGHPPERRKVGVHAFGFLADTNQEAKDAFFPEWQYSFARIGRDRGWSPPTRSQFEALCEPGGAFLIGDPQAVAAKVLAANDVLGGLDRITFQMTSSAMRREAMTNSIGLLGREVAPALRIATIAGVADYAGR